MLTERVQELLAEIDQSHVDSKEQLESFRLQFISKKGAVTELFEHLKNIPQEQRRAVGQELNTLKNRAQERFQEFSTKLEETGADSSGPAVDLTLPVVPTQAGSLHPLTIVRRRIIEIFERMGFNVADGPEIETDWYNFSALNFPANHPAREMQDTFFIDPVERHLVLRPHTSPVQVRSLLDRGVPLYVVAPGRVFRTDELDATHTPVFHQMEGIAIDKGLTMAHLRGTLEHLARALFGEGARIRLRPSYFPFTEPSAELDVWHPTFKDGARWIEWGGCGMVNPNVLRAAGIDPDEYQGFAFGMGIERTLMFRNDVKDMRDMVEGDIRFSQQFGMVV